MRTAAALATRKLARLRGGGWGAMAEEIFSIALDRVGVRRHGTVTNDRGESVKCRPTGDSMDAIAMDRHS
jgi:hypothetical protein